MAQPFIGEICCFGFNFAPRGWAPCDGRLLPIAQYDTLFALIGTTYGGDGETTFAVPNLQGRIPMHYGNSSSAGLNTTIGETMGVTNVTLTLNQIPSHAHAVIAGIVPPGGLLEHSAPASTTDLPAGTVYIGPSNPDFLYKTGALVNQQFSSTAVSLNGDSLPHDNMQPFLTLNFCIALEGIFPSRN